jgi:DNA-binding SARP family transcriptional activator/DNA-binding GntR family transcriptional regulator
MELRVLGPLEAVDGTITLPLGGRKPRALLARLALDANRTVAVQRLVDDLWGDAVPESATKMVQIYVSQLRKVLPEGVLQTRPPGYLIELEPDAVDATRFAQLRAEGRAALGAGDPETASARLGEALALWRGPALAEFSEPFAGVESAHLEELRLVCLEDRIEADVARGLHADVVGELEALVARHPLRESLHRQLALALYRAGRQAEALAAYERFRSRLDEELGIEPSPTLKALQRQILNQDPQLDARPPSPPRARDAAAGGFVGRAGELVRLAAALGEASAGAGTTVFVVGSAGLGKTRLTAELADRARSSGSTVLSGRCIQLVGTGVPYLPLVDALRPLRGSPALAGVRELSRLLPDAAGEAPAASRSDSRLALFEEVLAVLGRLGAGEPVVLVLEDLQWADESTLDLVAFLAHAIRQRRVLLVATYRSDEVRPGDYLYRLTTGLVAAGAARTLALVPLSRADTETLIAASSPRPLPDGLVAGIAARSEGNPFFARELLAAAARGETALPPVLRDALLGHVAELGPDAVSVLRVAAASGRDVSYGLLAAVMPLGELQLAGALRDAVEHDVLVPDHATSTFRFRHALFAEAVYATLLPGEREVLHQRLARALTEAAGGTASAEAAQHWAAAGRPVEALEASLRAAREAEAVSGLTEALRHVERVLELWDQVPAAEQLSGVALPSVLAWAAELADRSLPLAQELDPRLLAGLLGPGETRDLDGMAARLGVDPDAAAVTLATLESEGLIERGDDGMFRAAPLAVSEARRLYPTVVVLESLAVRQMPPLDATALAALRAANERLRSSGGPLAAVAADDDFHRVLTADCGNAHLLAALDPVRRALLRYERVYMREPGRIERSAAQHDGIIEALERGDHADAAQRVRENLSGGLPDLREALEE